jgi:hypothetical protein
MNLRFVSNAVVKGISVAATAVVILTSSPANSYANSNGKEKISQLPAEQVSVQYIGIKSNSFVFNVQFENPLAQKFQLIVKNDDGAVVFQEQFNDVHFSKMVLLPKDEGEIHPTFVIRTGNQQVERSFVANTKLTENVVVTKL